jgi:C1A family cysteine protease
LGLCGLLLRPRSHHQCLQIIREVEMLTLAKSARHRYHYRPPAASVLAAAPRYAKLGTPVPAVVDPRALMLPPRDQGQEGSCTGHGTTAARELSLAYATNAQPAGYLSPAFTYAISRIAEGTFPQDSGSSVADSMATLQEYGSCPETALPYTGDPTEAPTPACYVAAKPYRIITAATLVDVTDADAVREVLAAKSGIAIGITVYQGALEDTGQDGLVPVSDTSQPVLGGHEVCIVGYLDQATVLVRNSWSTSWGLGGYCIFQLSDLANICSEAWRIAPEGEQTAAIAPRAELPVTAVP